MGLTHDDVIIDSDVKCVIDYNTRKITTTSPKNTLVQYDHKSERVGFTMSRYNDGHDMTKSDRVTIVYANGTATGTYIVDDLALSDNEESANFTWLISNAATQNVASLAFAINFRCFDSEGNVTYNWSTLACSLFSVQQGMAEDDGAVIEPDFVDYLAKVQEELDRLNNTIEDTCKSAVADYLTENPVTVSLKASDDGSGNVTLTASV